MNRTFTPRNRGGQYRGGQSRGASSRNRFQGKSINPDRFINKNPTGQKEDAYVPTHSFLDFNLNAGIVENLTKKGYVNPTRIQDESIPHVLAGSDVIGLANTGSGKTAAFVLPVINKLMVDAPREAVLIIAPTRELAQQIQDEFQQFSAGMHLYSTLCVGGLNIQLQIRELRKGVHVVVGTPGRIKDLINQGELKLAKTHTLVLDETDRMLDMGFLPDINYILDRLPKKRQSLCFSATITPEISKLLDVMLVSPVTISVRTSETGEHIAQDVIRARSQDEKMRELTAMLDKDHFEKVLIFGQMKHSVQKLADTLTKLGYPAVAIHGNKSQPQRQRALDSFKTGKVNILVATDVAARGLDIPNVSHVINFDQPNTHEEYVHRIGRTGRAGKPGQAYTFVN
jgi:ATP-dependent RNA helicase RhlE